MPIRVISPTPSSSPTPAAVQKTLSASDSSLGLASSSAAKIARSRAKRYEQGFEPYFPVVLIPGFGSSGLVVESSYHTTWEGERIWLAFEKPEFRWFKRMARRANAEAEVKELAKGIIPEQREEANDDEESESSMAIFDHKEEMEKKSLWVTHLCLSSDGVSDPPGIKVRPMVGLEGIDYLKPGYITGLFSYVFGPVINQLKEIGYTDKNMLAAPYDWRLPPRALEERDKFFTNLKKGIEELYRKNNDFPVVLVCYSMGYKIIHYFLNLIKRQEKGQEWIDKYVHSLFSIAAPFLGSPQANRALITGEKLGLDWFLTDHESTSMDRSWGSSPILFQTGAKYYPKDIPQLYTRVEGLVDIEVIEVNFPLKGYEDIELFLCFELGEHQYVSERKTPVSNKIEWGDVISLITSRPFDLTDKDVVKVSLKTKERGLVNTRTASLSECEIHLAELLVATPGKSSMEFDGWVYFIPHDTSFAHNAVEFVESALEAAHDVKDIIKQSKSPRLEGFQAETLIFPPPLSRQRSSIPTLDTRREMTRRCSTWTRRSRCVLRWSGLLGPTRR